MKHLLKIALAILPYAGVLMFDTASVLSQNPQQITLPAGLMVQVGTRHVFISLKDGVSDSKLTQQFEEVVKKLQAIGATMISTSPPTVPTVTVPAGVQITVSSHSVFIGVRKHETNFNLLRSFEMMVDKIKKTETSVIVNRNEGRKPRLVRLNLRQPKPVL